jgi:hypothetical protein
MLGEMKKSIIVSLLLIGSMVLSSTPVIFGNYATATTGAANFLPNYAYPGPGTVDTANETAISLLTAQYITSLLAGKYPSSYYSVYGSNCDVNTYKAVTEYLKDNYNYAVIYSKGHRTEAGGQIGLIDCAGVGTFWDYSIGDRTSYSQNTFTFIWHCRTAEIYTYGGPNTNPAGWAKGMPYAYTHNHYLPQYGTSGHQVYLGWKDKNPLTAYNSTTTPPQYHNITLMGDTLVGSPQYEWKINPNYNYANVAGLFWSSMCANNSTYTSLDNLSNIIYGNLLLHQVTIITTYMVG